MRFKQLITTQNLSQLLFMLLGVSLVWFIILANITPFGLKTVYSSNSSDNISKLAPPTRVTQIKINGETVSKQTEDLIYFTTKMPFHFEKAILRITFQNPNSNQQIFLGFQDQEQWHYTSKVLDIPFLNSLSWPYVTNSSTFNPLILYQKNSKYKSTQQFLKNPPKDELIGVYAYEEEPLNSSFIKLANYQPNTKETIIDKPLRGGHTIFAYVENEPFKMSVTKQDLNWYEGEDPLNIRIYKDQDLVYTADIADDGVTDASHKSIKPQQVVIQNPGPELPERGTYKIVIDAGGDVIIKEITTNLHKLVFADNVFLAGNREVYSKVIDKTIPTSIHTNSPILQFTTSHTKGLQSVLIDDNKIILKNFDPVIATTSATHSLSRVEVPKNDVMIRGETGFFSFEEDQFYNPTPYHIINISDPSDLSLVDYLLTSYDISKRKNIADWQTAEIAFDLKNSVTRDGKLSWLIRAPGLKENGRNIIYKDIEIELEKDPIKLELPKFNLPI